MTRLQALVAALALLAATHGAAWWHGRAGERERWQAASAEQRGRLDAAHDAARQASLRAAGLARERDRLAADLVALSDADADAGRVALPARAMGWVGAR